MDFFEKLSNNPYEDLFWNLPEQKKGRVNIIGGSSSSFQSAIRTAEWLQKNEPIEEVSVILPDSLQADLAGLPNLEFLPSTDSGSFSGDGLADTFATADYNLLIGDLSRNTRTGQAISRAAAESTKPLLITRDAIDLLADHQPAAALANANLSLLATLAQLQKLLRAVFYPKMLTLSMPLTQVAETLHKFTLSYPVGIVTFHAGLILVAHGGKVKAVPLSSSGFTPLTLWSGQLAAKIITLNLFNPSNFLPATIAAIYQNPQ